MVVGKVHVSKHAFLQTAVMQRAFFTLLLVLALVRHFTYAKQPV